MLYVATPGRPVKYTKYSRKGTPVGWRFMVVIEPRPNRVRVYDWDRQRFTWLKYENLAEIDNAEGVLYAHLQAARDLRATLEAQLALLDRPTQIDRTVTAIGAVERFIVAAEHAQRRVQNRAKRIEALRFKLDENRDGLKNARSEVDRVRFNAGIIYFENAIKRLEDGLTESDPRMDVQDSTLDRFYQRYGHTTHLAVIGIHRKR